MAAALGAGTPMQTDNTDTFDDKHSHNPKDEVHGHPKHSDGRINETSEYNSDSNVAENNTGDALEAALAQLGRFRIYQKYVLIMLCIPNLVAPMYSLSYVFVADEVPFRCVVPECEGTSHLHFKNTSAQALLPEDSHCLRYSPLDELLASCVREDFHLNQTQACDMFLYNNSDTIFAEFGLACRDWLRTLVGTIHNAALPFALILTGYVSDSYGRLTAFCIFSFFGGLLGIVKAASVNYQMYLTMEFFEAVLGYGFTCAAYVMVVELAHPSLRATFACATGMAYGVGGMLFALVGWALPYWRYLLSITHIPALVFPLYWLLLDESARWLHVTGRTNETQEVLRKVAMWNKIKLDEDLMKALEMESCKKESQVGGNPWLSLLRSKVLIGRFSLCCWFWIATSFVYYGLTINSVSLFGNKYVNFALNMSMEVLASLLIIMSLERFGRKKCIFGAFLSCGVACVTPYFISHTGTVLGMFFLGKLAITFAFNSVYVYTAELFPTATRSSALAACSLVGRIGSILAPQTPLLSMYVQVLLYAMCSLTAALAVLLVPETQQATLPQGIKDAECIHKESIELPVQPPLCTVDIVLSANDT